MDIYESDNLDRPSYDSQEHASYYESLDWSDNVFGESIPGAADDEAAADDGDMAVNDADDDDVTTGTVMADDSDTDGMAADDDSAAL